MIHLQFLISFFLFQANSSLEPGIYQSNNELFIELKVNEARDSITFFFPQKSSNSTNTKWTTIEINPNYRKAKIQVDGSEIQFLSMESDFYRAEKPKNMKIKHGDIYVDCSNITEYLFSSPNLGNCREKYIVFKKK